ncbi:MAG: Wzz/FepE/Etk N-terminal domain-containing protein, partial [Pararhodobacter sp.]
MTSGPLSSRPPEPEGDEINLGQLILTLWKGKVWIVLCMVLGLAAAMFVYASTPPTYQADALLQLEENSNALSLPDSLSGLVDGGDPRSVTEIEILRSRMVLGQAVAALNLDWRVEPDLAPGIGTMIARYPLPVIGGFLPDRYARPGESVTLSQLVVPPRWLGQEIQLTAGEAGSFVLTTPDEEELQGMVGEALSLPETGFTLTVAALEAPAGRIYTIRQISETAAIGALRGRLTTSERGRASGILEARVSGEGRSDNVRALNAILDAYQGQNIARSAAQADGSLQFIREQIPQAEAALREAESALNAFRQEQVSV